jgi:FKBP-type peptidyl-prolyl cis-trans isomerase FklB
MKTIILTVVFSLTVAAPLLAYDTNVLSNDKLRDSYAIGMMLGGNWKQAGIEVNDDTVLRGLKDVEAGGATLMTEQEMGETLNQFKRELAAKAEKQRQEMAETNKQAGDAFLAENKEKKGVVTLPDGLQYKVISEGTGPSPAADDTVTVSYEGTLINGTKFDSSDKVQLRVDGVIRGWSEAIARMKVGSQWQLFIPPDLAYGLYGRPPRIGPNSVLVFTIKLLSIEHPNPAASNITHPTPLTSDIIMVPSAEEIKKGAKVQIIKPEDLQKAEQKAQTTN